MKLKNAREEMDCTERIEIGCKYVGLMNTGMFSTERINSIETAADHTERSDSNKTEVKKWRSLLCDWCEHDNLASELTTLIALLTTIVLDDCLFPEAPELSAVAAAFSSVAFFLCIALDVILRYKMSDIMTTISLKQHATLNFSVYRKLQLKVESELYSRSSRFQSTRMRRLNVLQRSAK
jgi:hypothetical protein